MRTLADLKKIREKAQKEMQNRNCKCRFKIVVGMGTKAISMGARDVMKTFLEQIAQKNLTDVLISQDGEKGVNNCVPIVEIEEEGKPKIIYGNINAQKAKKIIEEHIIKGKVVTEFIIDENNIDKLQS